MHRYLLRYINANSSIMHIGKRDMMEETPMSRSGECATCVFTNAGKLSCCARGGSWFNNCGDAGDKKFEHTWAEGIQACKGKL